MLPAQHAMLPWQHLVQHDAAAQHVVHADAAGAALGAR